MKNLIGSIAIIALCGCAQYQSVITVGNTQFKLPKNSKVEYMECKVPTTNGIASLVISNGSFTMDPAIINAATAHDVALINAAIQGIGTVAGAVVKP